jgi:hypothetical protein
MKAIICGALMALVITANAADVDKDSANYLLPYCKLKALAVDALHNAWPCSSFIRHSLVFAWCPMWALVRCFALPALIANAKIGSGRFLAGKFSRAEIPYLAFRQHFVEELPRDCS